MKFGTAYFDNIILKHFVTDMKEVRKTGCSFIVLTFSENSLLYHVETFRKMVAAAKKQGLTVLIDPWMIGGVFGGEAMTHLPMWHPEERQVRSDGKQAPALCVNSPALMRYLKKWVDVAASFKPDYILWDEPHFYLNWLDTLGGWAKGSKAWSCLCGICKAKFKKETGKDLPKVQTEEVKEFKRRCIQKFLLTLTRYAASRKTKNAMTFLPGEKKWFLESMCKEPTVQMMGGETYFEYEPGQRPKDVRSFAEEHTEQMKEWSRKYKKPLLMWVKGFKIPKGYEEDVADSIQGCVDGGADWVAVWGFEACKHVSLISPDDPDKVWKLAGHTYRKNLGPNGVKRKP